MSVLREEYEALQKAHSKLCALVKTLKYTSVSSSETESTLSNDQSDSTDITPVPISDFYERIHNFEEVSKAIVDECYSDFLVCNPHLWNQRRAPKRHRHGS